MKPEVPEGAQGGDSDSEEDERAVSGRDTGAEGDSENEDTPQSGGGFSDDATLARQLGLTEAQLRQRKKRLERKAQAKKKGGEDVDETDANDKPHED